MKLDGILNIKVLTYLVHSFEFSKNKKNLFVFILYHTIIKTPKYYTVCPF